MPALPASPTLVAATVLLTSLASQAPPTPGTVPITPPVNQAAGPGAMGGGNFFDNTKGNLVRFQLGHTHPITIDAAFGAYMFAPNNAGQRLSMVYLPTNTVVAEIPTGPGITAITDRPGTAEGWAVDSINGCISVIDPFTYRIMRTIPVGKEPHGIVFKADGSRAYVTCSADNRVDVIDCATYSVAKSIAIPSVAPRGITIANNTVWVTSFFSGNNTTTKLTQSIGINIAASQAIVTPVDANNEKPLPDEDLFGIPITASAATDVLDASKTRAGLGTILFNVHARPGSNELWIPNTDALNKVIGEVNLVGGKVANNRVTIVDTNSGATTHIDLDALAAPLGAAQPVAVAFDTVRGRAYVACFGSDRILSLDLATKTLLGQVTLTPLTPPLVSGGNTTPARCGPRGMVLSAGGASLLVFNGIDNSYSVVDLNAFNTSTTHSLGYDPTPHAIKRGMGHLANADHSGTKTTSCMTCHVDGHFDMLSWNLSAFHDPAGTANPKFEKDDKGPMATQSLRGLFEAGELHWRGEQKGLDDFNQGGFVNLMKRSTTLPQADFDELKAATFSLVYPANPRQPVNRVYTGAQASGQQLFRTQPASGPFTACASCHILPLGSRMEIQPFNASAIPAFSGKIPQLRGVGDKVSGTAVLVFPPTIPTQFLTRTRNGWGLNHSATVATLFDFANTFPGFTSAQAADVAKFAEAFDTGLAPATTHQATIMPGVHTSQDFDKALLTIKNRALAGDCDIVVAGSQLFGSQFVPFTLAWDHILKRWQTGIKTLSLDDAQLKQFTFSAGLGVTFFGMPLGTGRRFGVDRDLDDLFDLDEIGFTPFQASDITNPDSDGDGIPDGHEALFPGTLHPRVANTNPSPDTTPPAFTSAITVVYRTATTAKLEFSTDEPTKADLVIGTPTYEWTNSPTAGGYDRNHTILIRALTPGQQTPITVRVLDIAGNRSTQQLNITPLAIADGTHVTAINSQPLSGSTITVTVDVARYLTPTASLSGYTVNAFAHAEGSTVQLASVATPPAVVSSTSNTVTFTLTIPAAVLALPVGQRKLHFGVRTIVPPTGPLPLPPTFAYIEAKDLVNHVTITF